MPGICVPGTSLVAVGGREGDLLFTWGRQGTGWGQGSGISQTSGPQTWPTLTESEEDLVLLPLQVELVHPEQRLKLLSADIVQDLLGWGHKG